MDHEVTVFTRNDCKLCDEAKRAIDAAIHSHGLSVNITMADIDGDPALREQFTNDVPVIYIDGIEAFRHRVSADAFAAYVKGLSGAEARLSLAEELCIPCSGGVPAVKGKELAALAVALGADWRVVEEHHLEKEFPFPDFAQALSFTNRIGAIAETEGHHPDVYLAWGRVRVTIWTHKIDGLTRADFVLAAKIEVAWRMLSVGGGRNPSSADDADERR